MNRLEILQRLQTLVQATNLFGESSVSIGSGATEALQRTPSCRIDAPNDEPYGSYGPTLSLIYPQLHCRISVVTPDGAGHLIDTGGKNAGAIESLLPGLQQNIAFVDTTATPAHTTWVRWIRTEGPRPLDEATAEFTVFYEALATRT